MRWVRRWSFFIGQAMFADVQRHAAGEHKQHRHKGHRRNRPHGFTDALSHLGTRLLGGAFDVFKVDTGAEHPAPTIQHHHVGELVGHLA